MIFAIFVLYVCTQLLSVKRSLIETAAFLLQGLAVVSMSTEFCRNSVDRQRKMRFSLPPSARDISQNSHADGLTMGKVADIFDLVSRGRSSDRIPLRRSPRRAHGTLQPVWMKVL